MEYNTKAKIGSYYKDGLGNLNRIVKIFLVENYMADGSCNIYDLNGIYDGTGGNPNNNLDLSKEYDKDGNLLIEHNTKYQKGGRMSLFKEFEPIREWAKVRNIHKASAEKQFLKLLEEVGELSMALQKNNRGELIDAIGDCVVVLTNLAMIKGVCIENCINSAFEEIKDRKGKMIDGVFVKEDK